MPIRAFCLLGWLLAACNDANPADSATGTGTTDATGMSASTEPTTGPAGSASGTGTAGETDSGSGTDSVSATGSAGPDGTGTGGGCQGPDATIAIDPPVVMLVLDKSGSMVALQTGFWDHDGDDADDDGYVDGDPGMADATPKISRWNSLHQVVEALVTAYDATMDLGLMLFPSKSAIAAYGPEACHVADVPEVSPGPAKGAEILAVIPAAEEVDTVKGTTPASTALERAIEALVATPPSRPRAMILVTDGAANCSPDANSNQELLETYDESVPLVVAQAYAAGIPTYVVGIDIKDVTSPVAIDGDPDNTNTYERLNDVSLAGGVPREGPEKFYNAVNQIALQDMIDEISGRLLPCTLAIDPALAMDSNIAVSIGGMNFGSTPVGDCATGHGWQYTSDAHDEVQLCGDACALYRTSGSATVTYACP